MNTLFAEKPRACLGIPPESPLVLCLGKPERLNHDHMDILARTLACCPDGVAVFCRAEASLPADAPLSAEIPRTLPWQPSLQNALCRQTAPPERFFVLNHPDPMGLFRHLLPEASVVLDFPGCDAAAVDVALQGEVFALSCSAPGRAALQAFGLDKGFEDVLSAPQADRFVELAVNLAANRVFRQRFLEQVTFPPAAAPVAESAVPLPQRSTAADECEARLDLTIIAPNRPTREVLTHGLDLTGQIKAYYGHHRSGWEYVTEVLAPLHNPSAPYFESFVEKRFSWGEWCAMPGEPLTKPWVGIVHVPPQVPSWFGQENTFPRILETEKWQISAPYCRGLFTLTHWLKEQLQPYTTLPIEVLRHPTDLDVPLWSPERFLANPDRRLVQVGTSYRNLHAMGLLPAHPLKRLVLMGHSNAFWGLYNEEESYQQEHGLPISAGFDVEFVDFVANDVYDAIFAENVLFSEYYTASASNLIVECMARATPLLVNRLEPVVEYLGPDYPLYYSSYAEAAEKLHGDDHILAAHAYLLEWNRDILDRVTLVDDLLNSAIFKALDA